MKANHSPMSVADYCQAFLDRKIIINEHYQRKDGLWNNAARSFFIESILLEYPIPKLFLYARLDLKTRATIKEVVDGQQRTHALVQFFENKLPLFNNIETSELRGLRYNRLGEEWQTKFLSYSLPIDQFAGITEEEVREAFRRINANNVPLNPEEQRNAQFQGPFKWFINGLAEEFTEALFKLNLFSKRDMVRMVDLRLYAEIALTLEDGFLTVKGEILDKLYKRYNASFDHENEMGKLIRSALNRFFDNVELHHSIFLRPHVFQSLILSLVKDERHDLKEAAVLVVPEIMAGQPQRFEIDVLRMALLDPETFPQLDPFIQACTKATNTNKARAIRFLYFSWAKH